MYDRFTDGARECMKAARKVAFRLRHNYIGTEHLLIGLLKGNGVSKRILGENGVEEGSLIQLIEEYIYPEEGIAVMEKDDYTPRFLNVIEQSYKEAAKFKMGEVGTEHLLLALLKEQDCIAVRLLNTQGTNIQKLYVDVLTAMGTDANTAKMEYAASRGKIKGRSATPTLDQYSRDMTAYAKAEELDPLIGREEEIQRVIQILSRRTKNNPCLVGEPGVGKTAIAEGLARKIVTGDVPDTIKNKRVLSLDLSGIVAGSKYRGEFEERIKRIVSEVINDGNVLLFMDEIHTIIGAGGAEGAIDASNILKPSLARGELQLIGATTREEYRKYIEKDAALERRFQPVIVEEPSEEETLEILKGLRTVYEKHHQVEITEEALATAVKMSARYINDRFLPDKAIDLIDEASSKVRLSIYHMTPTLKELEQRYVELEKEKEDAIIKGEYEKASEFRKEQIENKASQQKMLNQKEKERKNKKLKVTENEIADIISSWTKIPVKKLEEEESVRLRKLEKILHQRVIGQEEAVEAVAKAIRRGRVGLKDPNRPIGSFLFLGPTGVGKTELSKALAEAMFGNENAMIRVDMSEYMEKHSVSKLIGSPPGYVGYEEGGQLSEKVRRTPYSVILFDEIEKAHPDVFNILLQVLDDGHITDAQGRKVSFKNTVIIMTSNAGAQKIIAPKTLGFSSSSDESESYKKMKEGVMEEVKRLFKPEFINRIDEIIVFHSLSKEHIKNIVSIMISQLNKRTKEQMNITIKASKAVYELIVEESYDTNYGARPLRRTIQTKIEDKLAEEILAKKIKQGDTVSIRVKDKEIIFSIK